MAAAVTQYAAAMPLELRHLRILATIAEHGSLTKAAAALGVSQPALSTQLRRIERHLGNLVFSRGVRGVTVTAYGEFVLARVRGALSNVDDLLTGAAPVKPARLSLGVIEGPLMVGMLGVLEELIAGCTVTLHSEYSTLLLLELVASRKLDAALLSDYPGYEIRAPSQVIVRPIVSEPGFAGLPASHPLAAERDVNLKALAGESWIVPPSDGTGWPEHMLDACRDAGFTPRVAHSVVDNRLQLNLISSGRAVAIVQATTPSTAQMAVRPLQGDPCWMRHQIAWHREGPLHDLGDQIVTRARDIYRQAATNAEYASWRERRRFSLPEAEGGIRSLL